MIDLVVKMLLDNKEFQKNLKVSKDEIQGLNEKISKITTVFKASVGAILGVTTALEGFKQIVTSCLTSVDYLKTKELQLASIQKSLWTSINSGNPSRFLGNIQAVVSATRQAYEDMIRLKNVNLFGNAEYAKLSAENEKLSMTVDDKNATSEERKKAAEKKKKNLERMDTIAQTRAQRYKKSYTSDMQKYLAEQGAIGATEKELDDIFGSTEKYEAQMKRLAELKRQVEIGTTVHTGGNEGGAWSYEEYTPEAKNIMNSREYQLLSAAKLVDRDDLEKAEANLIASYNIQEELYARQHEAQNEAQGLYDELKVNVGGGHKPNPKEKKVNELAEQISLYTAELGIAMTFIGKGKKLYEDYFAAKKELYKNDAKELKKVLQEELKHSFAKEAFEQELAEKAAEVKPLKLKYDFQKSLPELQEDLDRINEQLKNAKSPEVYAKLKIKKEEVEGLIEDFKNGITPGVDFQKSLPELQEDLDRINEQLKNVKSPEVYVKLKIKKEEVEGLIEDFKNGITPGVDHWNPDQGMDMELRPIANLEGGKKWDKLFDFSNATKTKQTLEGMSKALHGVGQAMRETGNESKAMARSMALISFAASMSQLIAEFVEKLKTTKNIWEFIAAGITGGAMMVSLGSQLHSINTGKFAEGGIVGGSKFSGDQLVANVNSGEMILNNRQQKNLFNLLNNDNGSSGSVSQSVEFKIRGKDLQGVLNNYNSKINKIR